MWHWAFPGDPRVPWDRAVRVPLTPWVAGLKRRAIGCFTSQLEDRPAGAGPVLHSRHRRAFHPRPMRCFSGETPVTLPPDYFDELYAASPDPWEFETRWYEARKYALSLALLPAAALPRRVRAGLLDRRAHRTARPTLRPACCPATGRPPPSRQATLRTASLGNVTVERRVIPRDWPPGGFDLIVFSEFLYYFAGSDLDRDPRPRRGRLAPGGNLLAVHWRHPVAEYPRSGDEVHQALRHHAGLTRLVAPMSRTFSPRCTSALATRPYRWPRPRDWCDQGRSAW